MKMLGLFLLLVIALFVYTTANSYSTTKNGRSIGDISNPMLDSISCGRKNVRKSAICDPDLYMNDEEKDVIEGYINSIKEAEIAVVVICQMNYAQYPLKLSSQSDIIESASQYFAQSLHDQWGIGSVKEQNGILIFLSVSDRVIYISTGSGVEKKLTKQQITSIVERLRSYLKIKKYGKAIENCLIHIDLVLSGKNSEIRNTYASSTGGVTSFIEDYLGIILTVCIWSIAIIMGCFRDRRVKGYERGKLALSQLMKEMDNTEDNNKFLTTSCPICLEEFPTRNTDESLKKLELSASTITAANKKENVAQAVDNETDVDNNKNAKNSLVEEAKKIVEAQKQNFKLDPQRPMALRCGHTFCFSCLETYLKTVDKNKCPICRGSVDGSDDSDGRGGDRGNNNNRRGFFSSFQRPFSTTTTTTSSSDRRPCSESFQDDSAATTTLNDDIQYQDDVATSAVHASNNADETSTTTEQLHASSLNSSNRNNNNLYRRAHHSSTDQQQQQQQQASPSHSTNENNAPSASTPLFERRTPEIRFRLNRMRYLYPDVMTAELFRTMNTSLDRGSLHDFRNHANLRTEEVQRIVNDIYRARAAARKSGSSGSSRSSWSGGGSSSGGGGGRW